MPIATPSGLLIALLAGRPGPLAWDLKMKKLVGLMGLAKETIRFNEGGVKHRRGRYPSVNTGISFGGGSKVCQ